MTTFPRFIPVTALALAMAAGLPAIAQTASVVTSTRHEYVYYGEHDIYFAPERKTYYWRDGERWESGTILPPASRAFVTGNG